MYCLPDQKFASALLLPLQGQKKSKRSNCVDCNSNPIDSRELGFVVSEKSVEQKH